MTKRHCFVADVGIAIEKLASTLDLEREPPFGGDICDLLEWATKDVLELKAMFSELDRVATHNYATKDAEISQLRQQLLETQHARDVFFDSWEHEKQQLAEVKEEKARFAAAALLTVQHDYQEIKSLKFQLVEREKEIGRLMNILEMIEHATAPSHDDGAFHENAYSLARSAKEQLG